MMLSMAQAVRMFTEQEAERLFREARWPNGIACERCGSLNIASRPARTVADRCRDCRHDFSVRTGTVIQGSNLPLSRWALAMYLLGSHPKGVSSVQMARDLGVTQKTAWHLAHRIRLAWASAPAVFAGPVEVDEAYLGGLERNKHAANRHRQGGGSVGKTIVVGARDRPTGRVAAAVVDRADADALFGFIRQHAAASATIYTDDLRTYRGMPFAHRTVNHSACQYVRGDVSTNAIESFWAMLRRGYRGTYHQMSRRHLHRYVCEFTGRLNDRQGDTIDRMRRLASGMAGKRLRYRDLIAVPVAVAPAEPARVEPYAPPPGLVDALARYLLDGTRPAHRLTHWVSVETWREAWRNAGMPPLD